MTSSLIFELLPPHSDLVARPLPLFHFIPLSKVPLLQQLGSDQFKSMCAENFEGMFRNIGQWWGLQIGRVRSSTMVLYVFIEYSITVRRNGSPKWSRSEAELNGLTDRLYTNATYSSR